MNHGESATVFTWSLCSRVSMAVIRHLDNLTHAVIRVVSLTENPARVLEFKSIYPSITNPFVSFDRTGAIATVEELSQMSEFPEGNTEGRVSVILVDTSCEITLFPTPTLDFLGREWKWSELLLNLIETFGVTLEKSLVDTLMPEEYILDCMKRNLGIETVNDCRIILYELQKNGMLEEVNVAEFRMVYHSQFFALNMNRESFGSESIVHTFPDLVRQSVHLFTRVRHRHSIAYLDFLDSLSWFSKTSFSGFLSDQTPGCSKRKVLVDLHCVLANQVGFFNVSLEAERAKFHLQFSDRKVTLRDMMNYIISLTDVNEREGVRAILYLKWTLSGNSETDSKLLTLAKEVFLSHSRISHKGRNYIPSFIESASILDRKYNMRISPFI